MDIDKNGIDLFCNSLNAQSGLSRRKYANTGDKRELTMSIYMERAQMIICELQSRLESHNKHTL